MTIFDKINKNIKLGKSFEDKHSNTCLLCYYYKDKEGFILKLYKTNVIEVNETEKSIIVNNGGYNTKTTADRIDDVFITLGLPVKYHYAKNGFLEYEGINYGHKEHFTAFTDSYKCYSVNFV